jgi:hypothetical protein
MSDHYQTIDVYGRQRAIITGLNADTQYEIAVKTVHRNDNVESSWSLRKLITTASAGRILLTFV